MLPPVDAGMVMRVAQRAYEAMPWQHIVTHRMVSPMRPRTPLQRTVEANTEAANIINQRADSGRRIEGRHIRATKNGPKRRSILSSAAFALAQRFLRNFAEFHGHFRPADFHGKWRKLSKMSRWKAQFTS